MDYKYIEQLLERYWQCQTTCEEEAILRTFFRQADVPADLLPYRQFFLSQDALASEHLPEPFAEKMLSLVGEDAPGPVCKAHRLRLIHRLRPLYQAAGLVALLLTIGNAAQQSLGSDAADQTPQTAQAKGADSLQQHITIGSAEEQSAVLQPATADTLSAITR